MNTTPRCLLKSLIGDDRKVIAAWDKISYRTQGLGTTVILDETLFP